MDKSEQINELAAALAVAQGKFEAVARGAENPFFKSKYATLDDMIAAVRGPLSEVGLAYSQLVDQKDGEFTLTTLLVHKSGQFISATTGVNPSGGRGTNDLQALGSALTYMKRYQLGAMLGVNTEADDDGNAGGKQQSQSRSPQNEHAQAAQEEKRRIAQEREAVKKAWVERGKELGYLSTPPESDEWAAFYEALGTAYDEIKKAGEPDGGFDQLREAGLTALTANAPLSEPEPSEEETSPDTLPDDAKFKENVELLRGDPDLEI